MLASIFLTQYADASAYRAVDISVPAKLSGLAATCDLGATIIYPEKHQPKAVTLFLHGSDPSDRAGTIPGGTAIYREIAVQLAQVEVASILFDKRTLYADCATKLDHRFLPEHLFEDALSVLNAAMARSELTGKSLYIFGHAQGATFALEMTARGMVSPRGMVLAAGHGRFPLDAKVIRNLKQLAYEQTRKDARKHAEAEIAAAEDFFQRLRRGNTRANESLLGAYAPFWRSWQEMTERTLPSAAKIKSAVLVLHGAADTLITTDDYQALTSAFTNARSTHARIFEHVTHHLTVGSQPGVARALNAEIAAWFKRDLVTMTRAAR